MHCDDDSAVTSTLLGCRHLPHPKVPFFVMAIFGQGPPPPPTPHLLSLSFWGPNTRDASFPLSLFLANLPVKWRPGRAVSGVRVGPSFSPRGATGTSAIRDPAHTSLLTDTRAPPPAPPGAVMQDRLLRLDFGHFHFSLTPQSTWSGLSPRETPRKTMHCLSRPSLFLRACLSHRLSGSLAVSLGLSLSLTVSLQLWLSVPGGVCGVGGSSPRLSRPLAVSRGPWSLAPGRASGGSEGDARSRAAGGAGVCPRRRIDPAAAPPSEKSRPR